MRGLPTGPIRKIAAGPNLTAAITEGNDLYLWGHHSPGPGLVPFFESLPAEPESIDVLGYDILDVACGKNYMMVLTTEHRLFVIGSNANGQLGLGEVESVEHWKEVQLPLREGARIVSVNTGYKNSFVVVENPAAKEIPSEQSPQKIPESLATRALNKKIEEWMATAHADQ